MSAMDDNKCELEQKDAEDAAWEQRPGRLYVVATVIFPVTMAIPEEDSPELARLAGTVQATLKRALGADEDEPGAVSIRLSDDVSMVPTMAEDTAEQVVTMLIRARAGDFTPFVSRKKV